MVKPAFLSREHYQRQNFELIACIELVKGISEVLEGSLHAARRLGLESDAVSLGVIWDELKAAVENLDSAICYLNVLENE